MNRKNNTLILRFLVELGKKIKATWLFICLEIIIIYIILISEIFLLLPISSSL